MAPGRRLRGPPGNRVLRRRALHPGPQRILPDEDGHTILDYEAEARETDAEDPVFELIDHERDLTCGVWEIPTPEDAREILRENGQAPAEEGY